MNIVQKVRKIVEGTKNNKNNIYGVTGLDHVLLVAKFSKLLAQKRKANIEIAELAGLLHDYSCLKNKRYVPEHEIHSGRFAQKILLEYNYPQEKIDIIVDAIYCHRGSKQRPKKTIEARCLADADAMAHFNAIPSLLYLAFVTYKIKKLDEAKKFVRDKLSRSWKKLSPDAKKLVKIQYEAAKVILK